MEGIFKTMGLGVDIKIEQIMQVDLVTVDPEVSIFSVAKLMKDENVGSVLIVNKEKKLLGIVTDRQVTTKVVANDLNTKITSVKNIMTANPMAIFADTTCKEALDIMGDYGYRRLPVIKDQKLVGIISLSDLAPVVELDDECITDIVNELSSDVRHK